MAYIDQIGKSKYFITCLSSIWKRGLNVHNYIVPKLNKPNTTADCIFLTGKTGKFEYSEQLIQQITAGEKTRSSFVAKNCIDVVINPPPSCLVYVQVLHFLKRFRLSTVKHIENENLICKAPYHWQKCLYWCHVLCKRYLSGNQVWCVPLKKPITKLVCTTKGVATMAWFGLLHSKRKF